MAGNDRLTAQKRIKRNVKINVRCMALVLSDAVTVVSALTHITRIRRDCDVANSPRYRDDNTLPHIARFHSEIQETLCKSREVVTVFLQNQRGDCFFYYHMQL